jgi:dTDP-4-amino-4,6-dideoxygalactose transaminase
MATEAIPFLDLSLPHLALEKELTEVFVSALRAGHFIGGPMVEEFERDFARYCGATHAIGVNSGTDALRFAFIAAGVAPGDIMITVPNTFIATSEAISQAGARPVFVDIDEETYTMDPAALENFLHEHCVFDKTSNRTLLKPNGAPVTAVVPVHLYGQMADMDAIIDIAEQYNLLVFEDACQAHGATYYSKKKGAWMKAGSMGKAAAFSFYPGKNLGALGEGGAVTTHDDRIAKTIRMLRDHGQSKKYYHEMEGYNGRLDAIQAGLLKVKLTHLPQWNEQRRNHAALYNELLRDNDKILLPVEHDGFKGNYHLYVVRTRDRDGLQKYCASKGIGTGLHYPVPLHLQNAYKRLGYNIGDFPITEKTAREIISLPMFPELTGLQQKKVAEAINEFTSADHAGGIDSPATEAIVVGRYSATGQIAGRNG